MKVLKTSLHGEQGAPTMSKTADQFEGVSLYEVWNYRLSTAKPTIYVDIKKHPTWVIHIESKSGDINEPLEVIETGIPADKDPLDVHNPEKLRQCYALLHAVRDKYALPNIEKKKPLAAKMRDANLTLAELSQLAREARKLEAEAAAELESTGE